MISPCRQFEASNSSEREREDVIYVYESQRTVRKAIQYYRGNPEELLRIRESKIEKAGILRRERNMKERKGGETAGTVS